MRELQVDNGGQCLRQMSLNTTYNDVKEVPPYTGIMFEVFTKATPLQLLSMDLDVRFEPGMDLSVEVYTKLGGFNSGIGDESQWTKIADTVAVPAPEGVGAILPVSDFMPVSMEPREKRSFYVTMKGPYLDHNVYALAKTGELQLSDSALDMFVGVGYHEYKFPADYDRVLDPQFAGVLHLASRVDCSLDGRATTVSYQFLFEDIIDVSLIADVSGTVDEAIESLIANRSVLQNFQREYKLAKSGVVKTTAVEYPGTCPTEFERCPTSYLNVEATFVHLGALDDGLVQHEFLKYANVLSTTLAGKLAVRKFIYIGLRSVEADFTMTLRGVPSGAEPSVSELEYFAEANTAFLRHTTMSQGIAVYRTEIESTELSGLRRRRTRSLQSTEGAIEFTGKILGAQSIHLDDNDFASSLQSSFANDQGVFIETLKTAGLRPSDATINGGYDYFASVSGMDGQASAIVLDLPQGVGDSETTGSNSTLIIAICGGVGGFLLLIALFLCRRGYKRNADFVKEVKSSRKARRERSKSIDSADPSEEINTTEEDPNIIFLDDEAETSETRSTSSGSPVVSPDRTVPAMPVRDALQPDTGETGRPVSSLVPRLKSLNSIDEDSVDSDIDQSTSPTKSSGDESLGSVWSNKMSQQYGSSLSGFLKGNERLTQSEHVRSSVSVDGSDFRKRAPPSKGNTRSGFLGSELSRSSHESPDIFSSRTLKPSHSADGNTLGGFLGRQSLSQSDHGRLSSSRSVDPSMLQGPRRSTSGDSLGPRGGRRPPQRSGSGDLNSLDGSMRSENHLSQSNNTTLTGVRRTPHRSVSSDSASRRPMPRSNSGERNSLAGFMDRNTSLSQSAHPRLSSSVSVDPRMIRDAPRRTTALDHRGHVGDQRQPLSRSASGDMQPGPRGGRRPVPRSQSGDRGSLDGFMRQNHNQLSQSDHGALSSSRSVGPAMMLGPRRTVSRDVQRRPDSANRKSLDGFLSNQQQSISQSAHGRISSSRSVDPRLMQTPRCSPSQERMDGARVVPSGEIRSGSRRPDRNSLDGFVQSQSNHGALSSARSVDPSMMRGQRRPVPRAHSSTESQGRPLTRSNSGERRPAPRTHSAAEQRQLTRSNSDERRPAPRTHSATDQRQLDRSNSGERRPAPRTHSAAEQRRLDRSNSGERRPVPRTNSGPAVNSPDVSARIRQFEQQRR